MWPFWIFSRSGIRAGPRNFGKWEQELCTLNISSSLCLKQKNTITVWNGTSSCRCLVYYFLLYSLLLRVVSFFFFSFPFKHSSSPSVVRPLSYSGLESQTCLSENHLLIRLPLHPWWFVFDGISPTGHQNKPEESEATQQPFFPFFWGGGDEKAEGNGAFSLICTIFDLQIAAITRHDVLVKFLRLPRFWSPFRLGFLYRHAVIMNVTSDFCAAFMPYSGTSLCKHADSTSLSERWESVPVTVCLHRRQREICWWFGGFSGAGDV